MEPWVQEWENMVQELDEQSKLTAGLPQQTVFALSDIVRFPSKYPNGQRLQEFDDPFHPNSSWWVAPIGKAKLVAQFQTPVDHKGDSTYYKDPRHRMVRVVRTEKKQWAPRVKTNPALVPVVDIVEYEILPWRSSWVGWSGLPFSLLGFRRMRPTFYIYDFKKTERYAENDKPVRIYWTGWFSSFHYSTLRQNLHLWGYEKWDGTSEHLTRDHSTDWW